jgi:rhodanese-related sulfurtransferase
MKNRFVIMMALAIGMIFFNSCADAQQPANADLKAAEFKAAVDKKVGVLLDIRTADEVKSGYIAGAKNIDWYSPSFKTEVAKLDKTKPVYVYCAAGGRSTSARDVLLSLGFKEVHQLTGGIGAWKSAGYPLAK